MSASDEWQALLACSQLPPPPSSASLSSHLSKSEMAEPWWLQPLAAAALCWEESFTGCGMCQETSLSAECQSVASVDTGWEWAEVFPKPLTPKYVLTGLSWAQVFAIQPRGSLCFGSFMFSVGEESLWRRRCLPPPYLGWAFYTETFHHG